MNRQKVIRKNGDDSPIFYRIRCWKSCSVKPINGSFFKYRECVKTPIETLWRHARKLDQKYKRRGCTVSDSDNGAPLHARFAMMAICPRYDLRLEYFRQRERESEFASSPNLQFCVLHSYQQKIIPAKFNKACFVITLSPPSVISDAMVTA